MTVKSIPLALLVFSLLGMSSQDPAATARCQVRLGISITGKSPDQMLLTASDPQAEATIDRLLAANDFVDQYCQFLGAAMNDGPSAASDATYAVCSRVLKEDRPFAEIFVGKFRVTPAGPGATDPPIAVDDPAGLGYFTTPEWRARYAGNEPEGYQLRAAYRMLSNLLDIKKSAQVQNAAGSTGRSARQNPPCSACHYDNAYGLDRVANLLPRRLSNIGVSPVVFESTQPSSPGETLFVSDTSSGTIVHNQAELLDTMVQSAHFRFNACRLAFRFLYGRAENQGEGDVFARCLDTFTQTGKMKDALKVILRDDGYCQ